MIWQEAFKAREEIVLATASRRGIPRAIVVTSLGFADDKLLIGVCQMKKSFENIQANRAIALVAWKHGGYYMISGEVDVVASGKYFEAAISKSKPPVPRRVVVVTVKEVRDLDTGKKVL